MATYVKAGFKTVFEQRAIVMDVQGASAITANVGDVVYLDNNGKLAARSAVANVANGDYIIAQSDMTMGYGHVPVENRDYRYSKDVAVTTTAKKYILYPIHDKNELTLVTETRT